MPIAKGEAAVICKLMSFFIRLNPINGKFLS